MPARTHDCKTCRCGHCYDFSQRRWDGKFKREDHRTRVNGPVDKCRCKDCREGK